MHLAIAIFSAFTSVLVLICWIRLFIARRKVGMAIDRLCSTVAKIIDAMSRLVEKVAE